MCLSIFFVKNMADYNKIFPIVNEDCEIYCISDTYPYFSNKYSNQIYVKEWDECTYTCIDSFSRYWLNEYKNIDKFITTALENSNLKKDNIVNSDHFKFDIVWELGQRYMEIIVLLKNFLRNKMPCRLYSNYDNKLISKIIESITKHYGIPHEII